MKYYLGIDLGGTNIVAGVVNEKFEIVARAKRKTALPRSCDEITADMADAAKEAAQAAGLQMSDFDYLGLGCPGMIDYRRGEVVYSNNLEFYHEPLGSKLSALVGIPVLMANDADSAAFGEFKAGAGRGSENMVAITLGTGVGSGIVIRSKLYSGFAFGGAEFGHSLLVKDGVQCTCGRRGCLEAYASATGLIRMTREEMQAYPESGMWQIAGGLDGVDGRTAFDGMRQGDAAGQRVVDRYIDYLAEGVVNIVNILQPEIICIGGGISKEGELLLAPIRQRIARDAFSRFADRSTEVRIAELGNDAGVIGAALLEDALDLR